MSPEEARNRHLTILAEFTIRARRLQAHSLSSWEHLHLVQADGFSVSPGAGQAALVTTQLPDEEQLESAAARARPLFLKGDPIHYSAVLNALGYFARHHPDLPTRIKDTKRLWANVKGDGSTGGALFESWLYGDLIHAGTAARAAAAGTSLQQRFQAAAIMVSRVFTAARTTMDLVTACQAAGLFTVPADAYTEPTSVTTGAVQQHGLIYIDTDGHAPGTGRDEAEYRQWAPGIFVHPDAWDAFTADVELLRPQR